MEASGTRVDIFVICPGCGREKRAQYDQMICDDCGTEIQPIEPGEYRVAAVRDHEVVLRRLAA